VFFWSKSTQIHRMTYYITDTITNTIYTHKSIHYADNLCRCTRAQHTHRHTQQTQTSKNITKKYLDCRFVTG